MILRFFRRAEIFCVQIKMINRLFQKIKSKVIKIIAHPEKKMRNVFQ